MSRISQIDPERYALPEALLSRMVSPALVIHLDRVRSNVQRVVERLDGRAERWRPHVKTVKVPEVLVELLRAGLRGFKCATLREARVLAGVIGEEHVVGADVLLAHPAVGPTLEGLAALARERPETRLSVLCEDPADIDAIPAELDVFADINLGMNRTGSPLEEWSRVHAIARFAGSRFRGIHAYEGHFVQADREDRRRAIHARFDELAELVARLADAGVFPGEVVTSGTPAFPAAADYQGFHGTPFGEVIHRVSPGTVVYHDVRTEQQVPELALEPATVVLCRVVSRPSEDLVTTDAGSKSIAADAGDPCAVALGWPQLEALPPSEEHLTFRVRGGPAPPRGTPLWLVPRHVCPTVNLADEALLIDQGTRAHVVRVAARAHDLLLRPGATGPSLGVGRAACRSLRHPGGRRLR